MKTITDLLLEDTRLSEQFKSGLSNETNNENSKKIYIVFKDYVSKSSVLQEQIILGVFDDLDKAKSGIEEAFEKELKSPLYEDCRVDTETNNGCISIFTEFANKNDCIIYWEDYQLNKLERS
ncbi:MAG: hypothetical protein ACI4PF_02365 [Christensenellales bacterium]